MSSVSDWTICLRKLNVSSDILQVESAACTWNFVHGWGAQKSKKQSLSLQSHLASSWTCNTLITTFHGGIKYTTFFGTYLHALVVNAPQQLEIVSLRSVNTENHEHIFKQARKSATAASNKHPQNVLYMAAMRLQAKVAFKPTTDSQLQADSIVA